MGAKNKELPVVLSTWKENEETGCMVILLSIGM